ncbi:hypothetical protein SAMN04487969_103171 [Paenibacillus algorifonticola]|uniref:DUF4064 domain-containing protein n=1 Tax=Paenibacillus algorifonticola TaxID=684063 RepID=A0A1I2B6H3_9BACL|nr:hypothetical protein [Paenibacillus algorifonticola]SFE51686.1 hypothetical protein SAMN04487969_103171 [Paenibacillus algorifonticola]
MEENKNNSTPISFTKSDTDPTQTPDYNPYGSAPSAGFSDPSPFQPSQPLKHSGLGIASFIMAIASIILGVISIIMFFAAIGSAISTGNEYLLEDPAYIEDMITGSAGSFMASGVAVVISVGITFVGLILGIIGACSKQRRKVFAIIGIILNGLGVMGTILFFVFAIAIFSAGASALSGY